MKNDCKEFQSFPEMKDSDHFPIMAKLSLSNNPTRTQVAVLLDNQ
jgi:hypothetical protein